MIKVTLEFPSIDAAIAGLARIAPDGTKTAAAARRVDTETGKVGDPVPAPSRTRKPRADKGQKREPYGPREQEANPGGAGAQAEDTHASAAAPTAATPGEASVPSTAPAKEEPKSAAEPAKADHVPAPGAVPSADDAQKALAAVFDTKGLETARNLMARFGVQRLRELPAEKHAEFIKKANAVLKGEVV